MKLKRGNFIERNCLKMIILEQTSPHEFSLIATSYFPMNFKAACGNIVSYSTTFSPKYILFPKKKLLK